MMSSSLRISSLVFSFLRSCLRSCLCRWGGRLEQCKVRSIAKAAIALKTRHLVEQAQLGESFDHLVCSYEGAAQTLFDHADRDDGLFKQVFEEEQIVWR